MEVPVFGPARIDVPVSVAVPGANIELNRLAVAADVTEVAGVVEVLLVGDAMQWLVQIANNMHDKLQCFRARTIEFGFIRQHRPQPFERQESTITPLVIHRTITSCKKTGEN